MAIGSALFLGGLAATHGQAAAQERPEHELKMGWLFNIFKSTDWPPGANTPNTPLKLGILGEDPFGDELLNGLRRQKVKDRPIAIQRYASVQEARACHALFISASEKDNLQAILDQLKDTSVLTVGEVDDFTRLGGIISLTVRAKQKFEYSKRAYERSKLKIDSRILVCGRSVP